MERGPSSGVDVAMAAGVLVGAAALIAILWVAFRRGWRRWMEASDGGDEFSLQQLRQLRDQGQITSGEFEQLKARTVADMSRRTQRGKGDA